MSVSADPIRIAVAANFIEPAREISGRFSERTGYRVTLSSGSSGKLYAQIHHGAPYDIFLSADQQKPRLLVADGKAQSETLATYAIGRLALVSSQADLPVHDDSILTQGRFQKLALANPKLAPYGVAATSFLESIGQAEATRGKWVMGENINQAFQFVYTGNAQLGLVSASQLSALKDKPHMSFWIIPSNMHVPVLQDMVVLYSDRKQEPIMQLWQYFLGKEAQQIVREFNYDVPVKSEVNKR